MDPIKIGKDIIDCRHRLIKTGGASEHEVLYVLYNPRDKEVITEALRHACNLKPKLEPDCEPGMFHIVKPALFDYECKICGNKWTEEFLSALAKPICDECGEKSE